VAVAAVVVEANLAPGKMLPGHQKHLYKLTVWVVEPAVAARQ
jgi:hypothetical protein